MSCKSLFPPKRCRSSSVLQSSASRGMQVRLSNAWFLTVGVLTSAAVAFMAGWTARLLVVDHKHRREILSIYELPVIIRPETGNGSVKTAVHLPYETATVAVTPTIDDSANNCLPNTETADWITCDLPENVEKSPPLSTLPMGQYVSVDIKNVDPEFLDSEKKLADTMLSVVREHGLSSFSFHCHSGIASKVACVGIAASMHLSVHAWPSKGVLSLDVFTRVENTEIPLMSTIERFFAVPQRHENTSISEEGASKPTLSLSHSQRGFRDGVSKDFVGHRFPLDQESGRRRLREIDISSTNNEQKLLFNRRLRKLNRNVAHQEALVHPAMISHPNPQHVAVIGTDCSILHEVLKHNTVEDVVFYNIRKATLKPSRVHVSEPCFDDYRVHTHYADSFDWLEQYFPSLDRGIVDKFASEDEYAGNKTLFDVIIVDESLASRISLSLFFDGLTENGIFASPAGKSSDRVNSLNEMANALENSGFRSIHAYEQASSAMGPWAYVVALRNYNERTRWFANEAEVEIHLHHRMTPTKSGQPDLLYFDAPTMMRYNVPPKIFEQMYCKQDVVSEQCDELRRRDRQSGRIPVSHVAVRMSTVGDYAGRGLFALQDIPSNSRLAPNEDVYNLHFLPSTFSLIDFMSIWLEENGFDEIDNEILAIYTYVEGYGFGNMFLGELYMIVDSGVLLFANHGCNGTFNYARNSTSYITEMNANVNEPRLHFSRTYSPVQDRNLRQAVATGDYTLRDILAGEEILANYLEYAGSHEGWSHEVAALKQMCTGEAIGDVTQYESEKSRK